MTTQTAELRPIIVVKMDDGNTFNLPWGQGGNLHEFVGLWKSGEHLVESTTGVVLMYRHVTWMRLATVMVDTTPAIQETKQ